MTDLDELGFKILDIEDQEIFEKYYTEMNGNWTSSLCFTSLFAWKDSTEIHYKIIGDHIFCMAKDEWSPKWHAFPIGNYDLPSFKEDMKQMIMQFKRWAIPFLIVDVSEWMLPYYKKLGICEYIIYRNNYLSDYIYKKADLIKVLNKQKKRYDYNYFIKKVQPVVKTIGRDLLDDISTFVESNWCRGKSGNEDLQCDYCTYGCMKDSIVNLIRVADVLPLKGIAVYSKNVLLGFSIVSVENNQLVFHFKLTKHGFRGINEFMHKETIDRYGKEIDLVNYTEDMGIIGLRSYKQRMAPYYLSHKYELSCSTDNIKESLYENFKK